MNTEKMTVSLPFDEWQRILKEINSYDELKEKYDNALKDLEDEKIKRRYYFAVGTDSEYRVAVRTVNLHGKKFEQAEEFEKMIKYTVEKEMELRKAYESQIKELQERVDNLWKTILKMPLWLIKFFGYQGKKERY